MLKALCKECIETELESSLFLTFGHAQQGRREREGNLSIRAFNGHGLYSEATSLVHWQFSDMLGIRRVIILLAHDVNLSSRKWSLHCRSSICGNCISVLRRADTICHCLHYVVDENRVYRILPTIDRWLHIDQSHMPSDTCPVFFSYLHAALFRATFSLLVAGDIPAVAACA